MTKKNIKIGDEATFQKTVTETDVHLFAGISGDFNPIHISDIAASKSIFGKRIVHGIILVGFISAVLANKLPGEGSIYLGQDVKFKKPVFIGDTITTIVKVVGIREEKNIFTLRTICRNQNDEIVIDGEAVILKN
ncbi:MaoC family dehydratase [Patiriisocius marinistellae]|nr:MaoC family dehydratase [Patiriisocius marinistellae]